MDEVNMPPEIPSPLEFSYADWTADTRLTLSNVNWNNDYRDIVQFRTKKDLDDYIDRQSTRTVIANSGYARANAPVRIQIPFTRAIQYNYLRADNPAMLHVSGDVNASYYYFILNARMVSPHTTELVIQLDEWQSYARNTRFGNCFIERGHIGIANENNFQNFGRDYLTVPEGLDTGADYVTVKQHTQRVMDTSGSIGDEAYDVMVVSTTRLNGVHGTVDDPRLSVASGSVIQGMPSGANIYIFPSANTFVEFMDKMKSLPWVTAGIISITAVPNIARYSVFAPKVEYEGVEFGVIGKRDSNVSAGYTSYKMGISWRTEETFKKYIGERYWHLKKFLTSPYTIMEMTTWNGAPVTLKPELWDDDCYVMEYATLVPPNQRVAIFPHQYNRDQYSTVVSDGTDTPVENGNGGEFLNVACYISNFPTFPIVNDNAINYMASNAHSLAFSRSAADSNLQKSMVGNQLAYDQASAGMEANRLNTVNAIQTGAANTGLANQYAGVNALFNGGMGVVGGATGGPAGLAAAGLAGAGGIMGAAMSNMQRNDAFAIQNNSMMTGYNIGNDQAGYIRDTNKSMADWAAKGDYETAIAGINAKVQDSNMLQPSMVGASGGEALNLVMNIVGVSLRWKMPDRAAIRRIGDFWLRYGYAVNQFAKMPADLNVMSKFTYWKLTETYITVLNSPESTKHTIRGIFEKGVTVWSNPDDIGNIDIGDNKPRGGVRL